MRRIKKDDVTLLIVLAALGILTYGWVPGAVSQIVSSFHDSAGEAP